MAILKVVLPIILLIVIGVMGRKIGFLTNAGIENIKFLVMKVILPVAIFNALGSADYNVNTVKIIAIFLAVLVVSFGIGFLLKFLIKEPYKKYLPFMVCIYEGGLMGYPLYVGLCGSENLSYVAILDIACLIFGFSVYIGLLEFYESGERFSVKRMAVNAIKNPVFIATLLGIAFGASGLLNMLITSPAGEVYLSVVDVITAGLSALVLITIGYSFKLEKKILIPCIKTIAIRLLLQAMLCIAVVFIMRAIVGNNKLWLFAVIMFMACPMTFSAQSFLKSQEGNQYVSTTNSIYSIITIIVYIVLAFLI